MDGSHLSLCSSQEWKCRTFDQIVTSPSSGFSEYILNHTVCTLCVCIFVKDHRLGFIKELSWNSCPISMSLWIWNSTSLNLFSFSVKVGEQIFDIGLVFKNEVRYNLKEQQHELETKGLTKEQLKTKFEDQIKAARADFDKGKKDCKDCKTNK